MSCAHRLEDFGFSRVQSEGAQRADGELCFEVAHVVEQQELCSGVVVGLDEQLGEVESDLLHEVEVLREGRVREPQVLLVGLLDEPQRALFVAETAQRELLLADVHGLREEQQHAEREDAVRQEADCVSRLYAWAEACAQRLARSPRRAAPRRGRSARASG